MTQAFARSEISVQVSYETQQAVRSVGCANEWNRNGNYDCVSFGTVGPGHAHFEYAFRASKTASRSIVFEI